MEIAKLIIEYIKVLIWPIVVIFFIFRFKEELKGLLAKALRSHEVELDILGQKIKLKALEKITEDAPDISKGLENDIEPNQNAALTIYLFSMISKLTTEEVFLLRRISQEITKKGYCGCEAERIVLERFVEDKILNRDERGFYHPTDIGKRLLIALKNL